MCYGRHVQPRWRDGSLVHNPRFYKIPTTESEGENRYIAQGKKHLTLTIESSILLPIRVLRIFRGSTLPLTFIAVLAGDIYLVNIRARIVL